MLLPGSSVVLLDGKEIEHKSQCCIFGVVLLHVQLAGSLDAVATTISLLRVSYDIQGLL